MFIILHYIISYYITFHSCSVRIAVELAHFVYLCLCAAKAKTLSAVWPEVEEVSAEVRAAQAKLLQLRPETTLLLLLLDKGI